MGVLLYTIVCGRDAHPYLTRAELAGAAAMDNFAMAALVVEANGVTWPEDIKAHLTPQFIQLVEDLLNRQRNRAGLSKVRR